MPESSSIIRVSTRRLVLAAIVLLPAATGFGQSAPTLATSPLAGLVSSDSVTVTATPSTTSGLNRVRLYRNGTLVATDTTFPYEFVLSDLRQNAYEIYARAEYGSGNFESAPLNFAVGAPAVSLAITAADPLSPGSASLVCTAYQGSGGAVNSVAFYRNGRFINRDSTVPYTSTTTNLESNAYQLTARADYRNGDEFASNPVSLNVSPPAVNVQVKASKGNSRGIMATGIVRSVAPGDVDYVQFRLSSGTTVTDYTSPYKARFKKLTGRKYRVAIVVDLRNGEDLQATSKVVRFRR